MPGSAVSKLRDRWREKRSKNRRAASPVLPVSQFTEGQSPQQGDVEHQPKTSLSIITDTCATRFPAAANAQPIPPSAGTRAGGHHQSTAAGVLPLHPPIEPSSQPTATESLEQPSPALSAPERLWNAAYDSLETDDADLVQSYVKVLEKVLGGVDGEPLATDLSAKLKDASTRQMYMRELVEKGQHKISSASRVMTRIGQVADAILSAKRIVDPVLQNVPQAAPAALPWAGVCIGLEILRNPAQATESNLAGIAHVVSRMDWYCALSTHLLNMDNIVAGNDFQDVLSQLEERILELYKALLLYQMKSVCSYYRNQGLVFLRGLLSLDDWDGDLKLVTDAEAVVKQDTAQFFQEQTKIFLGTLVKSAEKTTESLGNIHQTLQDFISYRKSVRKDDKEAACLRDLRVVDPQHDMERIQGSKDGLLDDAYRWVLRTSEYAEFTDWNDNEFDTPGRRFLWIKGHAGTGKTMLMIGIIRQLAHQPIARAPSLSFFFCQGTDSGLNNATAVLRSLIWLLLLQQPCLTHHLLQKHKDAGPDLFRDKNAFYALSEAFRNMLEDPQLMPVYLAVDALDECTQGRSELIRLISTSLAFSPKVKWLLSSRPEVDLLAELRNQGTDISKTPKALVELDTQRLAGPVDAYIDHKLGALKPENGYSDRVLTDVAREVRQRAENTFLWVALAFKVLETVHGHYAVKRIKEMPPRLSELYDHMMDSIEAGRMIEPQDCKRVLAVMSLAFRPLSIFEVSELTEWSLDFAEKAIEMCGSFLRITEGTVYFIHQSAKEYLEMNFKSRLQPAGPVQGHVEIYRRSIDALSRILRHNIYNLDPGLKPEDMTPPDPDPLAPIRYSCVFWVDHLCSINSVNSTLLDELADNGKASEFLKKYFLRWIESLSLLEALSNGLLSIRRLLRVTESLPNANIWLIELLKDAEKFVFSHRSIIEHAPLQTYGSALVFSPTLSDIRKRYWKERLSFIEMTAGIKDRWGAHRQTLEGHSDAVMGLAFSPDGATLASASDDTTIRLWDSATGAHRQTLEGHSDTVMGVVFSPDGIILVSASDDTTMRLWDTATGAYRQTLEGHRDAIRAVTFSPDGTTLASASDDNTIRLWDTATGAHRQTLEGHSDWVTGVAFSPDGNTLASASHDYTIRLWDTVTGAYKQTLEGHSDWVRAVAFSPDGNKLASASDDATIRLWDTASGAHRQTLKGHSNSVNAVEFSPDGTTLASASDDDTIRLWDTASGTHRQTLEGHSNSVNAVVFSPDGITLASASDDDTIRLWDTATGTHRQMLEGHNDSVRAIAFSPDDNTVVSASDDDTIRLWDAATGAYPQTLERHGDSVGAVAFSQDGKILVSASSDKTILLWDTATGAYRQTLEGYGYWTTGVAISPDGNMLVSASDGKTILLSNTATGAHCQRLEGHSDWVHVVAFSPDGNTLASASYDDTIRLWDTATGAHRQTLEGHNDSVRAVAFSPDGNTLASASDDATIRLWDTVTGAHRQTLEGHGDWVMAVAFSPDGNTLASASDDYTIRLWDPASGAYRQTLKGHWDTIRAVAFSPDGTTLASASDDNTIRLWDTASGVHQQTLEGYKNKITAVAFSMDGHCLVTNRGLMNIPATPNAPNISEDPKPISNFLLVDDDWVTRNGKGILWLPSDYRATCVAVYGHILALGHASGQVTLFRFAFID